LKSLIKYPFALSILLLIGYSQLFVQFYKPTTGISYSNAVEKSHHFQAQVAQTSKIEVISFEEEEEEDEASSKKHIISACSLAFHDALLLERNFRIPENIVSSRPRHSYLELCILRL